MTGCCAKTLFLIGNTAAHSSEQLLASVPQNFCSKSKRKFEEMEYLIHYVKFKMWPALFYVNSHCFPNSSIYWKLRIWNVGNFFPNLHIENWDWKLGYLNAALGWTFQFFPIHERDEKLELLADRQHFQIFLNSLRDWKLRWLNVEKESSNEQGWVKVGSF